MAFKKHTTLGLILASAALTSCQTLPTQWMPNGYRYQDNTPLSSPAPSRPWNKEAAQPSLENLGDNTASWQGAVYELVSPLPSIMSPMTGPVSLKALPPQYAATTAFDHYLRQALLSYAYTVNPGPGGVATITYHALPLDNETNLNLARAKFGNEAMTATQSKDTYLLSIVVTDTKGAILTEKSTLAILKHEKKEYARLPGLSGKPTQGEAYKRKSVYQIRE